MVRLLIAVRNSSAVRPYPHQTQADNVSMQRGVRRRASNGDRTPPVVQIEQNIIRVPSTALVLGYASSLDGVATRARRPVEAILSTGAHV